MFNVFFFHTLALIGNKFFDALNDLVTPSNKYKLPIKSNDHEFALPIEIWDIMEKKLPNQLLKEAKELLRYESDPACISEYLVVFPKDFFLQKIWRNHRD